MLRRSDIVFFFALLIALCVAWQIRQVLLLVYMSALFAVVLGPAIESVRRLHLAGRHPSRSLAIVIILITALAALVLFLSFAAQPVFHDAQAFALDWPNRVPQLIARLHQIPLTRHINAASLQKNLDKAVGSVAASLFGLFRGIAGGVFWFFVWLILTFYFISDGDRAFAWFMSLFPPPQRERLVPALLRAEARVQKWLLGQGTLMLLLAGASSLVFGLMRIRYFYALGVFAGLCNLLPIVGPITAVSVACLVAAIDSWGKVIGVLIFYFCYQQIETAFLSPRVMKSTLDLPPLAVIVALATGAALAGVLGALIAVPTAAILAVLVDEYLVKPHRVESLGKGVAGT